MNKAFRVFWSEEDREYVGVCPQFPSLSHVGTSPEAALFGIRALVDDVVAGIESTDNEDEH